MNIFESLVELLLPRYCIICGNRLSSQEKHLCVHCNSMLPRTQAHLLEENPIEQLFWGKIPIEQATSLFFYDAFGSRQIVYQMKYLQRPSVGIYCGEMMGRELLSTGFFEDIDIIIPVPLFWLRQMLRGYNQCHYFAKGLHNVTKIPVNTKVIKRTINNPTQTSLNHLERENNVKDIFHLLHPEYIQGKHILLVDDVITTGATILSCAQELTKAQNTKISIISIAYAGEKFLTSEK